VGIRKPRVSLYLPDSTKDTPPGAAPGRGRAIPPKLYRIAEIVEYYGVSRQTIHNYTTMGLITETRRTAGGHRLYDESVFSRLDLIEQLKRGRKSLRQIRVDLGEPSLAD